MKKYLSRLIVLVTLAYTLFLPFSLFSLKSEKAKATSSAQFLRITDTTTPFYSNIEQGEILFYIPYTYYVKLISTGELFHHVEYGGKDGVTLDGYVPNTTLFSETQPVNNPYPNLTLKTSKTSVLYADGNLTQSMRYVFAERELTYYGNYLMPDGTYCFYVGYGGSLGYVKESDVYPFTLSNHPNELTFIPKETPPEDTPKEQTENASALRIIIIVSLALAGLSGLVIVLKKNPKPLTNTGYYDENDYE